MRGKVNFPASNVVRIGITPAYAGKRGKRRNRKNSGRDHPRVCGEKLAIENKVNEPQGSPPRMRGKAKVWPISTRCWGITPAYAGKRASASPALSVPWDHPRVCGEKAARPLHVAHALGSPPRMRGKVTSTPLHFLVEGITPAYAGKRLKRSRSTVSPVAIVPLFPSVCNKPVVSDGSPAVRDVPLFLPAENAVPASPACNLRSL